jgi:hypothetical protein
MTPEVLAAWGRASRAASGVPEKIEDPAVLARLVTLAFAGAEHDDGGPPKTRRRLRKPSTAAIEQAQDDGQ